MAPSRAPVLLRCPPTWAGVRRRLAISRLISMVTMRTISSWLCSLVGGSTHPAETDTRRYATSRRRYTHHVTAVDTST